MNIYTRLIHKYNRLINNCIIQFSPPRSGSTLIYNILKDLFPKKSIEKKHRYPVNDLELPVVISYRHPLDCIASSIQRYQLKPTNEVIDEQISKFLGIWDVLAIRNDPNVLVLRYEDFFKDLNVIFNKLEPFFNCEIHENIRATLADRYHIDNIKIITGNMSSFSEYNKQNHWHGKHISTYKGRPYYYKEFFDHDQIVYLEEVYKKFLVEFNYIKH